MTIHSLPARPHSLQPTGPMVAFCMAMLLMMPTFSLLAATGEENAPDPATLARELALPVEAVTGADWQAALDRSTATSARGPVFQRIDLARVGQDRLLIRIGFDQPFDPAEHRLNLYLDLDDDRATGRADATHQGVDLAVALVGGGERLLHYHPDFPADRTALRVARHDQRLWLTIQLDAKAEENAWPLRAYGLLQTSAGGHSNNTPADRQVTLGNSTRRAPSLRQVATYRHRSDRVALESLENKGLRRQDIPLQPNFQPERQRPALPLKTEWAAAAESAAPRVPFTIPVHLLEEMDLPRQQAPVRFGFPLPEGAVTDLAELQLQHPDGTPLPATLTATSFWPDRSAKWVLFETAVDLAAGAERTLQVAFAPSGHAGTWQTPLRAERSGDQIRIDTGALHATIDTQRFHLLSEVRLHGHDRGHRFPAQGIELIDEHGQRFTTAALPPDQVVIEQNGPTRLVLRVEGAYADAQGQRHHRYQTRLTFTAGSARVQIAHTHVNDHLDTEFSDLTALAWFLGPPPDQVVALSGTADTWTLTPATTLHAQQWDEHAGSLQVEGQNPTNVPLAGVFQWSTRRGDARTTVTLGLEHFRQRWPKAFAADQDGLRLDLLPKQPDRAFGEDLPDHLRYGFVEGFYRSKWGMAFTERFSLDFSTEELSAERALAVYADTDTPLVAVVPADWYAQTQALGPDAMVAPQGKQFAIWDHFAQRSYHALMARNQRDRAFGYYNYGDWFGERGRNWGNNEYDMAQNYFLQFARTGKRAYFRLALAAARHQADVDIVHAYPDPYYLGANHQHSIGHTGQWSQRPTHATWSHRYDAHTSAANGHTWADGLVMAWQIAGEPRAGEAALALGEHITWAMAPNFQHLGDHERTAGWSLRAILALYRMTSDPTYLEVARHIAHVALREQDLENTGVWPHPLPAGHADGRTDLEGNNLYLMGILLGGLKSYHQETGDPAAERAILAAADWVARAWDPALHGWPYSALRDASPVQRPNVALNPLIATSMAYAGTIGDRPDWLQIARDALQAIFAFDTQQSMGKDISIRMYFVPEALALIQQWQTSAAPDQAASLLDGSSRSMAALLTGTPEASSFSLRAPDRKIFHVQLGEPNETLLLARTRHGALPRRLPATTVQILDAAGHPLWEKRYEEDPDEPIALPVSGQAGDTVTVIVEDDQRAVWHLTAPAGKVVAEVGPEFRIGAVRRSRLALFVPENTQRFSVQVLGIHTGMFGAAVIAPDGEMIAHQAGSNTGVALLPTTASEAQEDLRPLRTLEVQVPADQAGKIWHLVLWAAGDIGLRIDGIPPVIAQNQAAWFLPPTLGQATAAPHRRAQAARLVTIGDSTVASYNPAHTAMRGWGQLLQDQLLPGTGTALNRASSGRSSKSFLREGLWQRVLELDPKPDYVLIQFGHNDVAGKGPQRETISGPVPTERPTEGPGASEDDWFRNNLHRYIREARAAGIQPILISPMERANFLPDGQVRPANRPWALATAAVAEEAGVPLIDLNALSTELLPRLDDAGIAALQFINADGSIDRTHFSETGARLFAEFVARGLIEQVPALAGVIDPVASPLPTRQRLERDHARAIAP